MYKFDKLLKVLNIKFFNPKILETAFIHRSYLNEAKSTLPSNERLEFLGDAVLSLIISFYLYQNRGEAAEGELTSLRSYVVKTHSLAEAAQKLNLGSYLRLSKGEELSGGRSNPQLLANTFEALVGAVFLDQGLGVTTALVQNNLLPIFEKELQVGPPQAAKSRLQELTQNKTKKSPEYKILKTWGPDHAKKFEVGVYTNGQIAGRGRGSSKQEAEERAAKLALKRLT